MDLNHLLARHQIALIAVKAAASAESRCAHRALANGYARQVRALQADLGASAQLAVCS